MGLFWWWPFGKVPELSASQLDALRRQRDALPQLVDVRTPSEWQSGHIAGAVNAPITELGLRIAGLHRTQEVGHLGHGRPRKVAITGATA